MSKRLTLSGAVVVLLALAVMTASGATFVALGSIHTTASDFQDGTLTNMTVEGSGDSANVEYGTKFSTVFTDGFEDGDLDNWVTTGATVQTSVVNSGTYAAELADVHLTRTFNGVAGQTTFNMAVRVGSSSDSTFADQEIKFQNASGQTAFTIRYQSGSDQIIFDDGSGDLQLIAYGTPGTFPDLTVETNSTADTVTITHGSGTDISSATIQDVGQIDRIRYEGVSGQQMYVDDVSVETRPDPAFSAQYLSANHSVDRVTSGFVHLSQVQQASVIIAWEAWDGSSWTTINTTTVTTAQNVSLDLASSSGTWRVNVTSTREGADPQVRIADEGVFFNAREPTLNNSTASPNDTRIQDREVQLSINVSDADFATSQGDTVTTEFYVKDPNDNSFQSVGTDTVSSNGTTSLTYDATVGGQFEWYATATDSYGGTANSSQFTFETPGTLRIEDVQTGELINNVQVNVTFYGEDNLVVQRNTSDGTVDMTGLPADQPLTVELQADGYFNSEARLQSLFEQQTVYMLANDTGSSQIIFDVEDRTGQYPEDEALLFVERVVNGSWQTIAGGELNAIGQYRVQLENNVRHRLRIQNQQGDVRQLGSYTPIAPETVTIQVGSLTIPVNTQDGVTYDAYRQNVTGPSIVFEYADPYNATESLQVEIVERNNNSNVLLTNTTFDSGPYGTVKLTEPLDASEQNTTWVVSFHADRGSEDDVGARILVGAQGPEWVPDLPDWMQTWISVGVTLMVGGLFSTRNAGIGGVITAVVAGIFWYIGWFSQTSGIAVGIAIAGALMFTYVGDLSN